MEPDLELVGPVSFKTGAYRLVHIIGLMPNSYRIDSTQYNPGYHYNSNINNGLKKSVLGIEVYDLKNSLPMVSSPTTFQLSHPRSSLISVVKCGCISLKFYKPCTVLYKVVLTTSHGVTYSSESILATVLSRGGGSAAWEKKKLGQHYDCVLQTWVPVVGSKVDFQTTCRFPVHLTVRDEPFAVSDGLPPLFEIGDRPILHEVD